MKAINQQKEDLVGFSVDLITLDDIKEGVFKLKIIPDFAPPPFSPVHLRTVSVCYSLLEEPFLRWVQETNYNKARYDLDSCTGTVVQGGYYRIHKKDFTSLVTSGSVVTKENDVFKDQLQESPYSPTKEQENKFRSPDEVIDKLSSGYKSGQVLQYYGLNVGQGDSFLVICPNRSAYLFDTNFMLTHRPPRVSLIKRILIDLTGQCRLKALVITHKHVDHLRGANDLLAEIPVDILMMNNDYAHDTKPVKALLDSAQTVPIWINTNKPFTFMDGNVLFKFLNPRKGFSTRTAVPDINDSSLCTLIEYSDNRMILTGDASPSVLNSVLTNQATIGRETMLKVSHHGSRTGTDSTLISALQQTVSFISAGVHKGFCHPHLETTDVLSKNVNNSIIISKIVKRHVRGCWSPVVGCRCLEK